MANRFPLIANSSSNQIQELANADNLDLTGNNIIGLVNITATGVVTATSFVGNGSGLTGAGSTVADDTATNQTFYPLITQTTSGIVTASKISTTKLSFNPSTGTLNATKFDGDGSQLTGIDATALKDSGATVRVQANAGGAVVTGIVTATGSIQVGSGQSFGDNGSTAVYYGDGSNLTGISAGATLNAGSGDQRVVVTSLTTGTMTSAATDAELTYNSTTNTLSATTFSGALTGNSATASTLQTSRTINGVTFSGGGNIITNPTTGAYSNGSGQRTVQSGGSASGGSSGDIYYIY